MAPVPSLLLALTGLSPLLLASPLIPRQNPQPASSGGSGSAACTALKNQLNSGYSTPQLSNVVTTYYPANSPVSISNNVFSISTSSLPAFCRVQMTITLSSRTNSKTEVWLPDSTSWNGRYVGLGNSGLAGAVDVSSLGYIAIAANFAGMATDQGHTDVIFGNGSWGLQNPDAQADFGYRATNYATIVAKNVVAAYYGRRANKNYWLGCSTGGRQGWKEIEQYPTDYDGLVVGAPVTWESHLQPWILHQLTNVLPVNGPTWIDAPHWAAVGAEALRQCDAIDGVTDGVISDPTKCPFNPSTLLCRPGGPSTCLTQAQLGAIHNIYSAWVPNGTFVFNGYEPGWEFNFPLNLSYVSPPPFPIARGYLAWVYNLPTLFDRTPLQIYLSDVQASERANPGQLDAVNPDIRSFVRNTGKVLQYFGWADALVAPRDSPRFYTTIQNFMSTHGYPNISDYYRLFPVGGMGHCYGGPGTNGFGNLGAYPNAPPLKRDATHDVLLAMVAWVENGTAPNQIIATKYNGDDFTKGVNFTRPICPYPQQVKYVGPDPNNAASFICA